MKYASLGHSAGDKELTGTLRGFDVFVNMVLEEVEAYETTSDGVKVTKLEQILLNGNNIAVIVPGGKPEWSQRFDHTGEILSLLSASERSYCMTNFITSWQG